MNVSFNMNVFPNEKKQILEEKKLSLDNIILLPSTNKVNKVNMINKVNKVNKYFNEENLKPVIEKNHDQSKKGEIKNFHKYFKGTLNDITKRTGPKGGCGCGGKFKF